MRSGNHDAPVKRELPDREIECVGRNHSDVDDVGAGFGCAPGERVAETFSGRPHVASDDDAVAGDSSAPLEVEQRYEAAPDCVGDVVVQFGRINSADVVGLEYGGID